MKTVLEMTGLTKRFGGIVAVSELDLALGAGTVTGVIGPNGAGKSSMINLVCGLFRPSAGQIRFEGRSVNRLGMAARARMGILRTFQHPHILKGETVGAMLGLAAASPRASDRASTALADAMSVFGLADRADQVVDDLPYGYQKLTNLAMVWLSRPKVVLLDEPFAGVGPEFFEPIAGAIDDLAGNGVAIALVEHNLEIVSELSHGVIVIDSGREIFAGTAQAAMADPAVVRAYLGVDAQSAGSGERGGIESGSARADRP